MWPAPQRAGHITQLITTNEFERTTPDPKENAFATKCGVFAMNGDGLTVEKRADEAADTAGKHDPWGKVTAKL